MLRKILIISLFLATNCYADFPPVHWTEMDTDPSYYPTTIIMPAGSLSSVSTGIVVTFTGGSGGDEITVNTTAATNANFLDNIYIDWTLVTASTPDDITAKPNYAETLAGNPALLTTECIFTADGLLCEGTTADTIEIKLAFPDPVTTDKTLTFPNATDTLVGKATTDTLTNKTIDATNTVTINAADITDQNAGTDVTADLEEETHATEHNSGGADAITVVSGIITDDTITDDDIDNTTPADVMKAQLHFDIDGGGSAITTGAKAWLRVPFAMTIQSWDITADQSGSIVVDVWKDTYANFPPTVADTIAGTEKPTLASVQKNQDLTLSSWTTAVAAGDYIRINVDSITTVTKVAVDIYGIKI